MPSSLAAKAGLTALAALTLTACAPVIEGGPPMSLSPEWADTARIGGVTISTQWLDAEDDFTDTLGEEVREELAACANGDRRLDLRIHVTELNRAGRLETAIRGEGMHSLVATAEFVDPVDRRVVGRYPLAVGTQAGGAVEALLGDRQMMVSEEYGRALCDAAFGRNPRRSGPWNATRG